MAGICAVESHLDDEREKAAEAERRLLAHFLGGKGGGWGECEGSGGGPGGVWEK